MGCFGLVRGLSLLASGGVRGPEELVSLHAMLERRRCGRPAAGVALLAAIFTGAMLGAAL